MSSSAIGHNEISAVSLDISKPAQSYPLNQQVLPITKWELSRPEKSGRQQGLPIRFLLVDWMRLQHKNRQGRIASKPV
jgi:hypothetical protein